MGRPSKDPGAVIPKNAKPLVWTHFGDNLDGKHAHCILCKENNKTVSIKVNDGSTGALRNHIQFFHKKEWSDLVNEEKRIASEKEEAVKKAPEKKKDASYQPKIKDSFIKMTKVDPNGAKQSSYDKRLLEFLACNFVPFNVVNSDEFKNLVEELDRTINHKHSRQVKTFSLEILEDVKKTIKKFCDASAAITTDLWTSRALDSYISITVHFVDELFRLHRWTPFYSHFKNKHTGENIQNVIDYDIEEKLDIPESVPKWGVSDNAKNMIKAINMSVLELYTCNCHTQQLAIEDTFKQLKNNEESETIDDIVNKCGKLASHLHSAANSLTLLHNECEKNNHYPKAIPNKNETRWDSKHACMEGVLYHDDCLLNLARRGELIKEDQDGNYVSLVPTFSDFIMIKAAVKVLEKCKVTTKLFEQEKVPTIPLVVDMLYTVDTELGEFIDSENNVQSDKMAVKFAKVLRENLKKRFPYFGTNRILNSMGNYLNPSLKGIHLKLTDTFDETKTAMEEKLAEWKREDLTEESDEDGDVIEPPRKLSPTEILKKKMKQEEEQRRRLRITFRNSSIFSNTAVESSSKFRRECFIYESLPDAPSSADQLEWWKCHQEQFPILSYLVRIVFAVPVASSKSERVFSVAGNTVTPKRAKLGTDTAESLVVINTNLRILKEMGIRK